MVAMNSSVLACNYGVGSSSELSSKVVPTQSLPVTGAKFPVIRAQNLKVSENNETAGRRAALLGLTAGLFAVATSSANAGVIDEYLEKSKANKILIPKFGGPFGISMEEDDYRKNGDI